VLPEGGLAVYRNDPAFEARELFRQECASCHSLAGAAGDGPVLQDYNSRAWITAFLKDPQGPLYMGGAKKPGNGMKPVKANDEELAALTEFVYGQSGAKDTNTELAKKGEALFPDKNCDACHELDGTTEAKGPNLLRRGTIEYVEKIIRESAVPELYGERAKMPKFSGKLTAVQIRLLAEFVVGLKKS
jgi:ubiquinol-cytochrome c reductase cytochrome b subunit